MTREKSSLLRGKITYFAKRLGFDLVGFAKPHIAAKNAKIFTGWIRNKCHGKMTYLSDPEKTRKRKNLSEVFSGAKTVICLGMNYYRPQKPLSHGSGRVARYAYGRDYHKIIGKKLRKLEEFIRELGILRQAQDDTNDSKIATRSYVDTGPILERALAEQAGIGVIGKNSCLITKEFGSWVFLAEIITNLDLMDENKKTATQLSFLDNSGACTSQSYVPYTPPVPFLACGQCQRCIKACPTGAIIAPGVIDARKCISYLTIEHKGRISPALARKIRQTRRIFGCDICQEVCPHNISRQKPTTHKELTEPEIAGDQLELKKILAIKNAIEFLKLFAGSPLMRTKLKGLRNNILLRKREPYF